METAGPLAVVEQNKPQSLGRWPKGVSGNPSGAALNRVAARTAELVDSMVGDFDALSAIDRALLNQACLLLARSERMRRTRDADAAIRMSSEARRILASVRKRARPPATPTPTEYLTHRVAERAGERSGGPL